MKASCLALLILASSTAIAGASTLFIEAEAFQSTGGWQKTSGPSSRSASALAMLNGATGPRDGVATAIVNIKDAGRYRIWVRYTSHPKWRGPFHVSALVEQRLLGDGLFDEAFEGKSSRDIATWKFFEADLPEGVVTLKFSKHENKNASALARNVDCLLLTMDEKLVPNHLHFGAPTFMRVTLGEGYERPAYIHIFADHYHAPWYQHYSLSRAGAVAGVSAKKTDLLKSGEQTPWCNITPMIYQDSGAMLNISARYAYTEPADRLSAIFEFATAADEQAIVRTITTSVQPGGFAIYLPPNLLSEENRALLKTDREIADATGKLADAHAWPKYGKKPERFPFLVSAIVGNHSKPQDMAVTERELKTLDYFGFTNQRHHHVGGVWHLKNDSYCQPDLEKMKTRAAAQAADYQRRGHHINDIVFCELMDEPTGQSLEFMVKDPAYREQFQTWLKSIGKTPADLLVKNWDEVVPVVAAQRNEFPALYLFSQRFRTRALGDFMAIQRDILEKEYGRSLPTLVNFSDGAIFNANFYSQGVDYFELLDSPNQNAIWGEDWANLSSTYQCAAYNVDLMRAAARERGQIIGHHLIAHANRKPWDIKLKATSELARGVKILNNFCYGPSWATHEGGPYWRSHVWNAKPETWTANAELTREVGAVEEMLLPAMPAPAKVALLYSSSTDAWTMGDNFAYGFDRMHTWLALAHAQIPVDVVSEGQAERGLLKNYEVCYLTGPHLTRAAAEKLLDWVRAGGALWLTAGAASRDEFNRPLDVLGSQLLGERGRTIELQKHVSAGQHLRSLAPKDHVRWLGGDAEVLSVKQSLTPPKEAEVLATFQDDSPAVTFGKVGKGSIYCVGFLPSLAYIKSALDERFKLMEKVKQAKDMEITLSPREAEEAALLDRSANPWNYPAAIREFIILPVRKAGITPPVICSHPIVDVVYLPTERGVLLPLANYTLQPIKNVLLKVTVPRSVIRAESVIRGEIAFRQNDQIVEFSLPLENNDFVKLFFQ